MNAERAVWQIGCGSTSRSYGDVFFAHDVGLVGPGDAGPWHAGRGDCSPEWAVIRRFAEEVRIGDVVLVRSGARSITGVGIVAGNYQFLELFDDVNGWDLQHARRVRWYRLPREHVFDAPVFGANPSRFSRTAHEQVIRYANSFVNSAPRDWQTATLKALPQEEQPLQDVPKELRALVAEALDVVPQYVDRTSFGDLPTEDELVAHMVVPFLKALGWHVEQIAVKWRYVDVAVFPSLPRIAENCGLILEAKRIGASVDGALDQAKGYADSLGTVCDIVVTDGIRYRVYDHQNDYRPVAYANLVRLKESASGLFSRLRRT